MEDIQQSSIYILIRSIKIVLCFTEGDDSKGLKSLQFTNWKTRP